MLDKLTKKTSNMYAETADGCAVHKYTVQRMHTLARYKSPYLQQRWAAVNKEKSCVREDNVASVLMYSRK